MQRFTASNTGCVFEAAHPPLSSQEVCPSHISSKSSWSVMMQLFTPNAPCSSSFSWSTPSNTWLSLFQSLIPSFSSPKWFFAKSWFQDRAQKINNSGHCLLGRKWDLSPVSIWEERPYWPKKFHSSFDDPTSRLRALQISLSEKTHFTLTVFLLYSQPHYHPTVLFAFGSSPRTLGWKQKETTLILWFPE